MSTDIKQSNTYADADWPRLIADAHKAVLEQNKKIQFDPLPYENATELLELLPSSNFVDDRVELALDITLATRFEYRPDLSRRALYAAFPSDGELKDERLKRKWFTFTGIIEAAAGNVERSLKYKILALELCERLKDSHGLVAEWVGLSNTAMGAGQYEDAIRYSTIAAESALDGQAWSLHGRGAALLNRTNALMRLGRYADAESDVSAALMTIAYPPDASIRNLIVRAQHLFAELSLERGDLSTARTTIDAAATWADACGVPLYKLQVERVRARLSAFELGVEYAASRLRELLEQANDLETKFGQTSYDDTVLDVLHTLERLHRENGDTATANTWLDAIGEKLRTNSMKMLGALVDKPMFADGRTLAARMAEVDKYLQSKSTAHLRTLGTVSPSWDYLVALAGSASAVEDRTKEHGVRVARLAVLVARELGLSSTMQRGIESGCLIHDLGKISVPPSILIKKSPLDSAEQQLYDYHSNNGTKLLERVKLPDKTIVRNVISFHHHAYQGDPLNSEAKGAAIPLEARIASVCDRYDALVAGRPRRPAISSSDALRELFEQRSRDFDPNLVDVVIEVVRGLERTHSDVHAYLSEEADNIEYFVNQRTLQRAANKVLEQKRR